MRAEKQLKQAQLIREHGVATLDVNGNVIGLDNSENTPAGDVGGGSTGPNRLSFTCTLNTGTYTLPFDWTSERIKFEQLVYPGTDVKYAASTTFSLNQSLYINNMV